jgi:hypothetical protein
MVHLRKRFWIQTLVAVMDESYIKIYIEVACLVNIVLDSMAKIYSMNPYFGL